jgi:hypothetical protein
MFEHQKVLRFGMAAVFAFAAGCGGAEESANTETPPAEESNAAELEQVRTATQRFADVNVALAEGYIPDPSGMCITAAMEGRPETDGAMGIHYLKPDLLGLSQAPGRVNGTGMHTDFSSPAVLLYEPQADGSLVLVGVENLVWEAAWQQAGNSTPPSFLGNTYNHMVDNPQTEVDEAHGFEPHYDLHMWLYRDNPTGRFSPFNPAVTCQHAAHKMGQP